MVKRWDTTDSKTGNQKAKFGSIVNSRLQFTCAISHAAAPFTVDRNQRSRSPEYAASTCVWLIEAAALGLFLSFLVGLLGAIAALALSQFVLHPALSVALSDRKLDLAVDAVASLAERLTAFARTTLHTA